MCKLRCGEGLGVGRGGDGLRSGSEGLERGCADEGWGGSGMWRGVARKAAVGVGGGGSDPGSHSTHPNTPNTQYMLFMSLAAPTLQRQTWISCCWRQKQPPHGMVDRKQFVCLWGCYMFICFGKAFDPLDRLDALAVGHHVAGGDAEDAEDRNELF